MYTSFLVVVVIVAYAMGSPATNLLRQVTGQVQVSARAVTRGIVVDSVFETEMLSSCFVPFFYFIVGA